MTEKERMLGECSQLGSVLSSVSTNNSTILASSRRQALFHYQYFGFSGPSSKPGRSKKNKQLDL